MLASSTSNLTRRYRARSEQRSHRVSRSRRTVRSDERLHDGVGVDHVYATVGEGCTRRRPGHEQDAPRLLGAFVLSFRRKFSQLTEVFLSQLPSGIESVETAGDVEVGCQAKVVWPPSNVLSQRDPRLVKMRPGTGVRPRGREHTQAKRNCRHDD